MMPNSEWHLPWVSVLPVRSRPPDEITRDVFGFGVFEVAAQDLDLDFVFVPLQYMVDVGFADGDAPARGTPVGAPLLRGDPFAVT